MSLQKRQLSVIAAIGVLLVVLAGMALITQGNLLAGPTSAPLSQEAEPAQLAELPVDTTQATVNLSTGFILDPYLLRVVGSGDTDASTLNADCSGFVSTTPDVIVNWSGETEMLDFFTYTDSDPVLVIQTPSGDFVCSDDASLDTLDALVTIESPEEGAYNVHIGSFSSDELALGFVGISELPVAEQLAAMDLRMLLDRNEARPSPITEEVNSTPLALNQAAVFGNVALEEGFETTETPAAGGGDHPAAAVDGQGGECFGFISLVPTYSIDWSGSGSFTVFFESETDTAIGVITPDGDVICNGNAAEDNLNPVVTISDAVEGNYDIFVGTTEPHTIAIGTLTVTPDSTATPTVLSAE